MYTWYQEIWYWLIGECCWCHKKKQEYFTFGGLHKYTNLTVCKECFENKWPTLNYDLCKNIYGR